MEKITTRRREGVGVVVEKNEESRRTFNKNYYDLLTAITELLIVHSRSIFRYVIPDWLANYMIPTVNLCFAVRPIIETKTKCARAVIYSVTLYKWLPSQHTQTVPARVPYVMPHGARTVFPAGTRREYRKGPMRSAYGMGLKQKEPLSLFQTCTFLSHFLSLLFALLSPTCFLYRLKSALGCEGAL